MQNDTVQCSTSGHIKQVISQAVAQETPVKAFHCSHCVLIFKSKVYLFEHLNKVHGLDTETSLREAGLCSVTNKASTENSSGSSGDNFKCQHCDFKASSWDSLSEHEELCQKTSENLNVSGSLIISENLDTALSVITANQNNEAAGTSESPSGLSDISTSETKCTSKDLKTYKRPLQTITKYFSVSSGSNTKAAAKLADGTRGTLILQESPSSSCPNSSGVFKVTAKSVIDITASKSYRFLHSDLTTDLTPSKPQEQFKETVPDSAVKRSSGKSSKIHPAKKSKLDNEEMLMEKENESRQHSSSSNEFSFEVSEDDEDAEAPKVYSCKHCDYSDVGIRRISAHYQNEHPYIRYSSVYIQDLSDQSATFRCLECPVEFLSTADLKRHYMENHPEAPDVFMMKSYGLSLVFKCFLCTFTANVLKSLKEHYKAKHATYEVENSLLFCRYSMIECQEESSQPSPERSGEIPPEHTRAPQNPASKGADMALYKCKKCTFSHKSVVVMHVHYQKCHPDEAITIDKIKQSACVTSHAAPEMTPEKYQDSVTVVDPSETTPEASTNHSESSQTKKGESVESQTRCNNEITTGLDNLSSSSPDEMFYCQFCSYTSTKIKSMLGHHNAKHSMDAPIGTEDILWYSAEMQKKKLQSEAKMSKSTSSSQSSKQVKMCRETEIQHEEDHAADTSEKGFNSYTCPETLFYCQKCNFGNPTLKGVVNHQAKIHRKCNSGAKCVLEHTALVRDEIRKAKSNAADSSSHLPLPIMNEGDEKAIFCHFCNYRHSTLDQVMRHYCTAHHGFKVNPSDVLLHTSKILDQTQKSTQNQEVAQEPLMNMDKKKKKIKNLAKSLLISAPPPGTAPQTQRSLKCYRCTYSTEQVYALKTHIRKTHQVKRTVTDVLRLCFRQGALEPGYHCEFCAFKHEKAAAVYEHYQEYHPGRVPCLEFVSTRLYAGPGIVLSKKKKLKQKRSGGDGANNRLLFQRSGQNETGLSCRKCSFKSNSLSDLAHHYRAVHPLGAKEDRMGLNTKKASTSWQVEDHSEIPGSFDSYQVPLEFGKSLDEAEASSTVYKCPHCSTNFNTQHGLHVHCGMKHPEALIEKLEEQQKPQRQLQKRVHVFKCPYCTYVNTIYQGVLTHCQMKHPDIPSRADSLHVDMKYVQNWDDPWKSGSPGESLKLSGHMCKTCPQICATLDKLNKHCEQDHKKTGASTAQSTVKSAPKPLAKSKILLSKAHSMHGSISKASFLSKKIYAVINCQLCSYTCTTKFALGRHLLANHRHAISKDCVYKCVLCSKVYFRKKHLGGHYAVTHGKEAYLKYYVAIYKQALKKPSEGSSTQQQENASDSCKSSITAEDSFLVYKCPKCPYVNASYHGTLTHCQMKHPAIVVRADELETGEVLAANMVKCSLGKGSNQRGYMCKKCSQIHASLTKLNVHCKRDHNETEVSEHSAETENQPVHTSQGSAQEDAYVKKKTSEEVSVAETRQAPQIGTPETILLAVPSNKQLYKCQMCTYKGLYRKYLQCHYKNTHKLDSVSIYKLLEKYNKRKWKFPSSRPKSEDNTNVKCLKCPNLTFDSSQLLIDHYNTFHRSEWKLDFTVLSLGSERKKTTGVYKCDHCKTQLNGIRKVCYHMDRHRARIMEMAKAAQRKASLVIAATPEQESSEPCRQDEMPMLETVEEVNQWNETPVQSAVLPTSPARSPPKVSDVQQPELESNGEKHTCKLCGRMFMSLKGLRSHEHSHAALAAIKKLDNLPTSALKHNISKYVIHKSGTLRPFLCSCCTYRTTVFGLWRSHFMKKHQDLIMDAVETEDKDEEIDERADKESSNSSEKMNNLPEFDEEPELVDGSLYLEPPDVQRQLNHYTMMAQSSAKSKVNVQESKLPENSVLHCEICNFSTGHLSSIRRHYLNRHGKKILRCKDCSFFTGLRKTLEMHMETGHSTWQSEPTHQKDLRCPFCLYQTKNKNNMIDHIVLHREERVVPIEVRRPKLSRYLQGIVFRCHKCTFTSGSPENLHLHMMRHNDIKPYKCRLCYFDCTQLSDLEAHLSDKHQVVRNHELVGQVSLDQLEAKVGRMAEAEEEHLSNMEQLDKDREDVEMEEFFTDCDEVPQAENLEENNTTEKTALQIKEVHGMQGQERHEESPGESSELDIQHENAKPNATVQQDLQKKVEMVLPETAGEEEMGNVEQSVAEVKITDTPFEDSSGPEEERQTNENQALPKFIDCEGKQQKEMGKGLKVAENTPAQKQDVKALEHKTLNIEARVEDDILRHILQLDGDDRKMHIKADEDRTVKMEKGIEGSDPSDLPLAKESSFTLSQNQKSHVSTQANSALTKINIARVNNTRTKESFRIERHMLTLPPNCARFKMISGDILGVSFAKFKREQVHTQKSTEQEPEPCREMPVLEKECLKKEVHPPECFKEEEEKDPLEQKQNKESEIVTEDENQLKDERFEDQDGMKEGDCLQEHKDTVTQGPAEVLRASLTEQKRFTCEFCGRNLMNSSELKRHVMRHGI